MQGVERSIDGWARQSRCGGRRTCSRKSLSSSHEELNISPKKCLKGARSHNPTKLLCLNPQIYGTREITSLTGTSSHEERSPRDALVQSYSCIPYRGMTPGRMWWAAMGAGDEM